MARRIFALALLVALAATAEAAPAAPGFRLKTLDGRTIDSNDLIGKKIVVLRFQASYCKPCARESPALNRVFERYRDRDVEVIAIHVQDTAHDTRAFVRAHRATYPVALDPRLSLGNRFGFKGTPYTVVIDRRGEMAARLVGEGAVSRLPRMLDALLAKDAKPS
ncbi:MAG TPA: TlpA disulfide reductase family protein [Methylomirabilota bacterium]|nr:TlpA disulfide reductase family protein [Methylomirabilota bacterium]